MVIKGKIFVFTETLKYMTRTEAAAFIECRGGTVQNHVSRNTNVLVVGHKQMDLFSPDRRSRKLVVATDLVEAGQQISIITEDRFLAYVKEELAEQ